MKVIARSKEKEIIHSALTSNEAELIVIWGRRRVGKTFLVRFGRENIDDFFFEVTGQKEAKTAQQLENFRLALGDAFYDGQTIAPLKNWSDALRALKLAILNLPIRDTPITVFFDEAAWLDSPKSGFLGALEYFWNSWASGQKRVKLFVCASASSWILNKILKGKGGWHRRATKRIHLRPFTLGESRLYLESRGIQLSDADLIELYMLLGGTPAYLKLIERGLSLSTIVNKLFFENEALLEDEFDELFYSLFKNTELHIKIVRSLSKHRHGLSQKSLREDIGVRADKEFSRAIRNLVEADFIQSYLPIGETAKSKRRFRLTDFFSLFYLSWIGNSDRSKAHNWHAVQQSQAYRSWAGFSFETLCWNHIDTILSDIGLQKAHAQVSAFDISPSDPNEESARIDLVVDVQGAAVYIIEVKHYRNEYVITAAEKEKLLRFKRVLGRRLKGDRSVFILLLSSSGVKTNSHSDEVIDKFVPASVLFRH